MRQDLLTDMGTRAICAYIDLTPGIVSKWLGEEYLPDHVCFDPVAAYLETEFPGINVETGLTKIVFRDGDARWELDVLPWHDLLLAKVANGMTSADGDLHGFYNTDDARGASVEALRKLLGPRPVSPVVRMLRTVSSALKTAFKR